MAGSPARRQRPKTMLLRPSHGDLDVRKVLPGPVARLQPAHGEGASACL
eukprot:CAMPEP_0198432974 /NCGR_PEP_ID=MMETSP1452-20131203/24807_1 /TAXON_ID=1181717 /ORGANISM="Synchroma pusillum, Strain CCMP3072" /LENGTH=48 /DNA_ID= /DNA_START= /DNA_END= /DNA_ORIENTATION=